MSHHVTPLGRPFVECDDPVGNPVMSRCGRRSYGRRDRLVLGQELDLFDLPNGWAVAPYPDDFDHGATRRNLLDGTPIRPIAQLVGLKGDLHSCPPCGQRSRLAS